MVLMLQNSWRMKSLAVATIEDDDDCQQLGGLSVYSDDTRARWPRDLVSV